MTTFQFREPLRQVPIFDHEGRKKYLFHSPEIPVCIDPKLVADQLGHGLGVRIPRWQ